MKLNRHFVFAAVMAGMACAASAERGGQAGELYQISSGEEAKIQAQVLNSILGPGKAFVFLELKVEVNSTSAEESKGGIGEVRSKSDKPGEEESAAPGKAKKDDKDKKTEQSQTAHQVKNTAEKRDVLEFRMGSMKARILYNAAVPAEKLRAVTVALLALYPGKIQAEDIVFVSAEFDFAPGGELIGEGMEDGDN